MSIADEQITSFDGVEVFPDLQELKFYKLNVKDISQIFMLEELAEINLQGGRIEKPDEFEDMVRDRGIRLRRIPTLQEQIINNN